MDIAYYQGLQFDQPPCWELVSLVYRQELGFECREYKTINGSIRSIAKAFALALYKSPQGLSPLTEPAEMCIVLMGKTEKLGLHHCGIYYEGSVLHALPDGTLYQDIASLGDEYALIEYWGRE